MYKILLLEHRSFFFVADYTDFNFFNFSTLRNEIKRLT